VIAMRKLPARVERVLDYASGLGYRTGNNPARLELVEAMLPHQDHTVEHHKALSPEHLVDFMRTLRETDDTAARALEFLILTGARAGMILGNKACPGGMRWDEIDLDARVWSIPAARMKAKGKGFAFEVPLSDRAIEVLGPPGDGLVFKLYEKTMIRVLRRLADDDTVKVHAFRALFRSWAGDTGGFPFEVCEAAIAHVPPGKVVQAYTYLSKTLELRRKLMQAWADHLAGKLVDTSNVVALRSA
jgi:integrase